MSRSARPKQNGEPTMFAAAGDPIAARAFASLEKKANEEVSEIRFVSSTFRPGRLIADRYLIERELALGGVGVVMLATNLESGQHVALKVLRPHLLGQATTVERFKREADLAASLQSEHVVRIQDVGVLEDGSTPFMVMEYLEGEDLGAIRDRGLPLAIEVVVDWVCQACKALSEAHAHGIIHRDLKPENLFLARQTNRSEGSIIKVVDFGISKVSETPATSSGGGGGGGGVNLLFGGVDLHGGNGRSSPRRAAMAQMTLGNESFGTPEYMSPEQLMSARNVDARSDIWAMGVVLYELLSMELPFKGNHPRELMANVLTSTPTPLRAIRPEVKTSLEAIVMSCLERHPKDRPATMDTLLSALEPFRTQRETLMPAPVAEAEAEAVMEEEPATTMMTINVASLVDQVVDSGDRVTTPLTTPTRPKNDQLAPAAHSGLRKTWLGMVALLLFMLVALVVFVR